jgi:hypothetical protein
VQAKDGRFSYTHILKGTEADLRVGETFRSCRPDAARTFLRLTQRAKTDLEAWKKEVVCSLQLAVCKISQAAFSIKRIKEPTFISSFLSNKVYRKSLPLRVVGGS